MALDLDNLCPHAHMTIQAGILFRPDGFRLVSDLPQEPALGRSRLATTSARHATNYAVGMGQRAGSRKSRIVVLVFAVTDLLVLAGPARAAVVLKFDPPSAPPGATIEVRSVGQSLEGDRFDVFLALNQQVADEASGAGVTKDPRLVWIGRFAAEGPAADRFTFTVPNVGPGKYVAVLHCRGCGSGGSSLTALGRFRVTTGLQLPATGSGPRMLVVAGGALMVVGQIVMTLSRVRGGLVGECASGGRTTVQRRLRGPRFRPNAPKRGP